MSDPVTLSIEDRLAEAVRAILAGPVAAVEVFAGAAVSVSRSHYVRYDPEQLKNLVVTVVPRAVEHSRQDRMTLASEVQITVAVQKKLDDEQAAPVDALKATVQRLKQFLLSAAASAAMAPAAATGIRHDLLFEPEHYGKDLVFSSAPIVIYRVATPIG